jgi:hypothetical protein
MHPAGLQWVGDIFADEPWYTFAGVQSGHGADDNSLRFLQSEDYATRWKQLAMPFVNLEPNYELAYAYGTRNRHGAFEVRRAAYWSLLVAPPAGVTYGSSPIWIWSQSENERAQGHSPDWTADPWHTALTTPGIESMATMRTIMDRLRWTQLRPAPQRLADQPGEADPNRFIAAAESKDGAQLVLYIPAGDRVVVMFENAIEAKRIDPRTGSVDEQPLQSSDGRVTVDPPNERDWLFVLKR